MKAIHLSDINWKKTKAVIFDLDGTIYNKRFLSLHLVANEVISLPFLMRERMVYRSFKGRCFDSSEKFYDAFFEKMARGSHLFSANTARSWYFNNYMPLMFEALCFFYKAEKWALDIIHYCNDNNIAVCVVSDYCFVKDKLRALQIDPQLFTFTIATPDLGGLKPNKRVMEQVVEKLGVPAENCLMIGDREDTDGDFARSVGAMFLKC